MNNLKRILTLLLITICFTQIAKSQAPITCSIFIDNEEVTTLYTSCYGSTHHISASTQADSLTYEWLLDGISISNEASFSHTFETEATLSLSIAYNETEICTNSIQIAVRDEIEITFEQLQLTCNDDENGGSAKVKATISGEGSHYSYTWIRPSGTTINQTYQSNTDTTTTVMGIWAYSSYKLIVTDEYGCSKQATFTPEGYPFPEITITSTPDTAYIQNPTVLFSFENTSLDSISAEVINFSWDFDDGTTSQFPLAQHVYTASGAFNVNLRITTSDGCDTTFTYRMIVLPVNLFIPNVITPNGDGFNDFFIIQDDTKSNGSNDDNTSKNLVNGYRPLNDYYEKTELVIFNRWGRTVYESNNYQNNWDGGDLPDGPYFYVLRCYGRTEDKTYQGSVTIFRGHR